MSTATPGRQGMYPQGLNHNSHFADLPRAFLTLFIVSTTEVPTPTLPSFPMPHQGIRRLWPESLTRQTLPHPTLRIGDIVMDTPR